MLCDVISWAKERRSVGSGGVRLSQEDFFNVMLSECMKNIIRIILFVFI